MSFEKKITRDLFWVLLTLMVIRMVAMIYIPLNDHTEARYGEIARIMAETHNWITLMQDYPIPFWAKPPLSTWLSAWSILCFGETSFAVRLPALLLSAAVLWLVWGIARTRSLLTAVIATLVLAGSCFFYLDAGTVMTDPALLFCTTLMMVAFWRAVCLQESIWGYVFFIAMGLGLLAKGPIALVLVGLPIGLWVLLQNKWRQIWKTLPWVSGILMTFAIAAPWYYLAEQRTPGFLHYFIWGEHIQRFLQPHWQGDQYGFAHVSPMGMIWIYALLGILPWAIPGLFWLGKYCKQLPNLFDDQEGWIKYLLLCCMMPLFFFTFARNIIYPYVFPSLPAFALLFAEGVQRSGLQVSQIKRFFPLAMLCGVGCLVVTAIFLIHPEWVENSQYRVINAIKAQQAQQEMNIIYWSNKAEYSAQFYSRGRSRATLDPKILGDWLRENDQAYLVIDFDYFRPIPQEILGHMKEIQKIKLASKELHIFVSK